jgi:hypothetical protein
MEVDDGEKGEKGEKDVEEDGDVVMSEKEGEKKEEDKEEEKVADVPAVTINKQTQDVGNVLGHTKIFFEYKLVKSRLEMYKDVTSLPFQVQIVYVRPSDGAKMLRVITQRKEVTRDRKKVLENLNMDILGSHISQKAARLCEEGDYESARSVTFANGMWMQNNAQHSSQIQSASAFLGNNLNFDSMMQEQQQSEAADVQHMDKEAKRKVRKSNRSDSMAKSMYRNKKAHW